MFAKFVLDARPYYYDIKAENSIPCGSTQRQRTNPVKDSNLIDHLTLIG